MAELKLKDAPAGVRTYYEKGVAAIERGNLEYAIDMFEAALGVEPRLLRVRELLREAEIKHAKAHPPSKFAIAKAMPGLMKTTALLKKDPHASLAAAEKLLRIDPFNTRFVKAQRDAALAAELPEVAIQTLEILKANRRPDLAILEPLAKLYFAAENFEGEYECRAAIAQLKPNDSTALKELKDSAARLTMGKAGWKKAESFRDVMNADAEPIDELAQARAKVEAEPDNLNFQLALADLLTHAALHEETLHTLDKCSERSGATDPRVEQKILAAKERLLAKKIAAAEDADDCEAASALNKELGASRIANAAGQVERYPNDLQLKFEYGKRLFDHGKLTEAIQQLQLAQRNPARRVRALQLMAEAFEQKGQFDIALEQLEAALAEQPTMDEMKKETLYALGSLHEKLGDPENAMRLLKEIYAVDIGYRDVAARVENTPAPS